MRPRLFDSRLDASGRRRILDAEGSAGGLCDERALTRRERLMGNPVKPWIGVVAAALLVVTSTGAVSAQTEV